MTSEEIRDCVAVWKKKNLGPVIEDPELSKKEQELVRRICCVPYHTDCKIKDCVNRVDQSVYNRKSARGGYKDVSPRPKFVTCIHCNVFNKYVPIETRTRPVENQ